MAKQYRAKFITRVHDIIKDLETPHYPDLVMHSKALITMLISLALKKNNVPFDFRNDRKTSYEEKLEFMLDNNLISEQVFDNAINAISLRNPMEHIYTYPNKLFAQGAASAALDMYMSLQPTLDLPHIPKAETWLPKLDIEIPHLFRFKLNRIFNPGEFDRVKQILDRHKGSFATLMEFPEGTYFKDKPLPGIRLNEKVQYSELLLKEIRDLEMVEMAEYAGMEIVPMHPHNAEYYEDQYPSLKTDGKAPESAFK